MIVRLQFDNPVMLSGILDKMELPPLREFQSTLRVFNIKKCYQYLLYFAKSQIQHFEKNSDIQPVEFDKIPTEDQRNYLIQELRQVLCLQRGQISLRIEQENKDLEILVLSAQRFIMGMVMLGHVHVFEIMINELMPTFIKIIQREVPVSRHKQQIMKKICQFCQETLFLLSVWFPKNFYDNTSPSWFKNIVGKYGIALKFIVYYTNDKIDKYENVIKELKFNEQRDECFQCKYWLEVSGKSFYSYRVTSGIPSVVREEGDFQQSGSSIYNKKSSLVSVKNINPSDTPKKNSDSKLKACSNIPLESKFHSNTPQKFSVREQKSNSPNLSERIRKHRQERKQKQRANENKNALRSRGQYYQHHQEKEKDQQRETKSKDTTKRNRNQVGEVNSPTNTSSSVNQTTNNGFYESAFDSKARLSYMKYKQKIKKRVGFKNQRQDQSKQVVSEKVAHDQENFKQSRQSLLQSSKNIGFSLSIFNADGYQKLPGTMKKLFRKQVIKIHKKRLVSRTEPWSVQIKCKPRGKKLELRVELMSDYANKLQLKLLEPKRPQILLKEGKNVFFFNMQKCFYPFTFQVGDEPVLIPVSVISMMEPLDKFESEEDYEEECNAIMNSSVYRLKQIEVRLDTEVYNSQNFMKYLKFTQKELRKGNFVAKRYRFFSESILLVVEESQIPDTVNLKIFHRNEENDDKVNLVLKEMQGCLERSVDTSNFRKVIKRKARQQANY